MHRNRSLTVDNSSLYKRKITRSLSGSPRNVLDSPNDSPREDSSQSSGGSPRTFYLSNTDLNITKYSDVWDLLYSEAKLCEPLIPYPFESDKEHVIISMEASLRFKMILTSIKLLQQEVRTQIDIRCQEFYNLYQQDLKRTREKYIKLIVGSPNLLISKNCFNEECQKSEAHGTGCPLAQPLNENNSITIEQMIKLLSLS